MRDIRDVAVDPSGNLYVSGAGARFESGGAIAKFLADGRPAGPPWPIPIESSADTIGVDGSGNLYAGTQQLVCAECDWNKGAFRFTVLRFRPDGGRESTVEVSGAQDEGRAVTAQVAVSGAGQITVTGSFKASKKRSASSVTACRKVRAVKRPGTFGVTCALNLTARQARAKRSVLLRLAATFKPIVGKSVTKASTITLNRSVAR